MSLQSLWDFISLTPCYFSVLKEKSQWDMNYLEELINLDDVLVSGKILVNVLVDI